MHSSRHLKNSEVRARDVELQIQVGECEHPCAADRSSERLLLAFQQINRLMLTETNRRDLCEQACVLLTETLGYHNTWIVLFDPSQTELTLAVSSGFAGRTDTLKERLRHRDFPACISHALTQDSPLVITDPAVECLGCRLALGHEDQAGLSCSLRRGERILGVLTALAPPARAHDAHEHALFHELAALLAFSLSKMEAEEAMRESERDLRLTQKVAHLGNWRLDVATQALHCSEELYRIYGLDPHTSHLDIEQCLGSIHPDDRTPAEEKCLGSVQAARPFDAEYRIIRPDGERRAVRCIGEVEAGKDGKPTALFGTLQDVTKRRQADEDRAQLEEKLHLAQKHESIGRLAGTVAHDLNNLLSPMLGYAEILGENTVLDARDKEAVEEIVNAGKRAKNLIGQLLTFSQTQTLKARPLCVNSMLKEFERLLRQTIRNSIVLRFALDESIPPIKGDAGQLEQVVMNLAVNAQDSMPSGGELTIKTRHVILDESDAVDREAVQPGAYVVLAVKDTGSGIKAETIEHLFEPFYTTKQVDKGTGLGLAIVNDIVKRHGGAIRVHSTPARGSTFEVYLPSEQEPTLSSLERSDHPPICGD